MPRKTADSTPELFETQVDLCRFLLVIDPAPAASARVMDQKQALRAQLGRFSGMHSIPHITLFFADLPVQCERDLAEGIARGCEGQRPFKLKLDGITHFPDKRTIYIDPVEKEPIGALRKSIVDHVRAFKRVKKLGVNVTDHPHLTIAAGLEPPQFDQAWSMLAPHVFKSEQNVYDVVLLRRALSQGAMYEHVKTFPLEPAG
jgi:2'-5' RNA ligase